MSKSSVYTKTGDKGQTGLVGGTRISKDDLRIEMYGQLDELNSFLGLVVTTLIETQNFSTIINDLKGLQSDLFDLGSNLACEKENRQKFKLPEVTEKNILFLENKIDSMDSELPSLKSFILPGGVRASSELHVCRTVCRRIERSMVSFENTVPGEIPEFSLTFINRLSDYFFVLARYVNFKMNGEEVLWKPKN